MKIAVLLMVHKNIDQIYRMLHWFEPEDIYVFIHCDRKMSINVDGFEKEAKKIKNNVFISCVKRESGELCNWSLIEISLNLIDAALNYEKEKNIHFSYFHLISGQDYFINTSKVYLDLLNDSYPCNYLDIDIENSIKRGNWIWHHFDRYRLGRLRNCLLYYCKNKKLRFLSTCIIHGLELIITLLFGSPLNKLKNKKMNYGVGSPGGFYRMNILVL